MEDYPHKVIWGKAKGQVVQKHCPLKQKRACNSCYSSFSQGRFQKASFKMLLQGFPGGAVVENLPANAGDTGSRRGLGRSHMPRSNQTREPQLLSLRSATRETTIVRGPRTAMKSGPRLPQLEKALAQKRRPNIAINQSINKT